MDHIKLKYVTCLLTIIVTALFSNVKGQVSKADLKIRATGGVYSLLEEEVHNVYGSGPLFQLQFVAKMSKQSRLKIGGSYFRTTGNPYYSLGDFIVGDTGTLSLNSLSMVIELGGKTANNPKVYVGAGVLYYFGSENIDGHSKNNGDGLGALISLSPEFQLSGKAFLVMEAGLRLVEVKFRNDNRRYTFNLSGGTLSIGLAYRFGR
ncbi:MAG: hypothetical protein ACE5IR_24940 [bacterium]